MTTRFASALRSWQAGAAKHTPAIRWRIQHREAERSIIIRVQLDTRTGLIGVAGTLRWHRLPRVDPGVVPYVHPEDLTQTEMASGIGPQRTVRQQIVHHIAVAQPSFLVVQSQRMADLVGQGDWRMVGIGDEHDRSFSRRCSHSRIARIPVVTLDATDARLHWV